MKLKVALLVLFAAGLVVSAAVASSSAGAHGKPPWAGGGTNAETAGPGAGKAAPERRPCLPARMLLLRGEFAGAGGGGFALAVAWGNRPGQAWKGKQATVLVDERTRYFGARRELADLVAGDRVTVLGFACRADAAAGTVLARHVVTHRAKGGSTTTATTTSSSP